MKRHLAFLLALVMLFSVFGGANVFAADDDGTDTASDTLVVYTKSGATRTFHVGDTFTYTYWLRLSGYDLGQFSAHILYDSACISLESWTCPNFPNQLPGTYSNKAGNFRFHTAADLTVFNSLTPQQLIQCTFRVVRGGTTYIRPILEELEAETISGADRSFVKDFSPTVTTLYATYDRLQNETPSASSTKLTEREDVVWYYVYDNADGAPIPAGVEFLLTGTSGDGTNVERTATTDEYGFLCFGNVPFGDYYLQCNSATEDGYAYLVTDDTLHLPYVVGTTLTLDNEMHADRMPADALRSMEITFEWRNEEISAGENYTGDRPDSLYLELSANGTVCAQRAVASSAGSVTIQNLRAQDAAGNEIAYQLAVSTLDQYQTTVTQTETGFHVDFTYLNNHTWDTTRVEPTCTESGYIESICSDPGCGAANYTTLPALGHDYAISGTPASCTEYGYQVAVCKRCGVRYVEQTEPLGHDWSEWTITKDATDTEDGERVRTCLRCGAVETQLKPGPNHVHVYEWYEQAATCTEPGYLEKRCACGQVDPDSPRYETPALGHDYSGDSSIINIQSPTCTEDGIMQYTCTRCGEIHDEILPKLGHNWELVAGSEIPATCEKTGSKEYRCGNCGDTKTVTEPALGHSWGDWIVDTPATNTTEGSQHRVCTRCGKEETEVIPKLAHTHEYNIVEVVEPTCTEQGYTRYVCSCGASFIDGDSYVDALGHSWTEVFRQPATERSQGLVQYQCTRCGQYRYETLRKLPAGWKNPFWDVNEGDWYYDAVCYVAQNDLMIGTTSTRFSPNQAMSRAMLVTVLYRMVGEPKIEGMFCPFTDVPANAYYADAVAWAYTCQIVLGVTDTTFCPNQNITREQMVSIFYRYAVFNDYNATESAPLDGFPDANKVSAYAVGAMSWGVGAGLISGVGTNAGSELQPQGAATRAQAAAIIMRFDQWRLTAVTSS